MRILFLTRAFNGLTQRLWLELTARGCDVSIEFDVNDACARQAAALWRPDLVIAPYLTRAIPEDVWRAVPCLVVHPGPLGDRGPCALEHAILDRRADWGVTVLQAVAEMDAGPVWAHRGFAMRPGTKSSLYRREVTDAAVEAVIEAIDRFARGLGPIMPQNLGAEGAKPALRADERAVDWARDGAEAAVRRIRASDGQPGAPATLAGIPVRLHDAWPAPHAAGGPPGAPFAQAGDATLWAARDGAFWVGHLSVPEAASGRRLKLPATVALARLGLPSLPLADPEGAPNRVSLTRERGVAAIRFPFLNGAMGPARCRAVEAALREAADGPERVILLLGGPEFWSNGIDLCSIEAADRPAEASMEAIEAMDDLCLAILETRDKLTVAAVGGDAGAGGVFLALAADEVWTRPGVVLNPHYRNMGNLYGSEYWTYLLPRRLGAEGARALMATRMPLAAREAVRSGLFDRLLAGGPGAFASAALAAAARHAAAPDLPARLAAKAAARAADEAARPLAEHRAGELAMMRRNFFGFDTSYHVARFEFATHRPHARTPLHLARHRRPAAPGEGAA
jgi:putative two-component system hydrogenase maturation factor HypX/HoxX